MEVEETTTESSDVVEIPLQPGTEEIQPGAGDEKQPDLPTEEKAPAATEKDAPKDAGFSSLFAKAREAVKLDPAQDAATSEKQKTGDDSNQPAGEKAASDEKVPEEEKPAGEKEKQSAEGEETDDKTEDTKEPEEGKKPARGEAFKQVVAERDTLKIEVDTVKNRLEELDTQFEKHGGVEIVESAMELFDLAADKTKAGEFVERINSLPHHATIQKEIFDTVIDVPANRAYGVNRVLQEDFGLAKALPQTTLEKVFELVTSRVNADADDFENFLDRELELAGGSDGDQSENARLRAEIERLKNPPKEEAPKNDAPDQESQVDFANRIQKTYNDFEDAAFAETSAPEISKYGFNPLPNDTPEVKQAKEFLASAVKLAVAAEMRSAKAHEPLLEYWVDDLPTDSPFYKQAAKNYRNAMKIKVQTALKQIAPLLGAAKATLPKEESENPKDPKEPNQAITQKAAQPGAQRSAINPPKKDEKPKGFGGAFQQARKTVGK